MTEVSRLSGLPRITTRVFLAIRRTWLMAYLPLSEYQRMVSARPWLKLMEGLQPT